MAKKIQTIIEAMFAGVSAKDVDAAVAPMADDIELFDPHYPYPDMKGVGGGPRGSHLGVRRDGEHGIRHRPVVLQR